MMEDEDVEILEMLLLEQGELEHDEDDDEEEIHDELQLVDDEHELNE